MRNWNDTTERWISFRSDLKERLRINWVDADKNSNRLKQSERGYLRETSKNYLKWREWLSPLRKDSTNGIEKTKVFKDIIQEKFSETGKNLSLYN